MFLDKKNEYSFSIKAGQTNITIPFEMVIVVIGGIFLIKFIEIIRTL
jgi:hypothetical protein